LIASQSINELDNRNLQFIEIVENDLV